MDHEETDHAENEIPAVLKVTSRDELNVTMVKAKSRLSKLYQH